MPRRMKYLLPSLASVVLVAACSSSAGPDNSKIGNPDASSDAKLDTPDGPTAKPVDPKSICDAYVAAKCSGTPAGFAASCPGLFNTAQTRGCKPAWIQGLSDFVAMPGAVQCEPILHTPTVLASPSVTQEAALGEACTGAVNNSRCYGVSCNNSLDCSAGFHCNSATTRCFEATTPALSCAGLPCAEALDCPGKCNSALGACTK